MVKKFVMLIVLSVLAGVLSKHVGMTVHQAVSVGIFSMSILGTLFFWDFRLSFVFLGTSILLMTKTIDLEHLLKFSSLEVILFLVGMMILVGLLKESGFFAWLVSLILRIKNLTANKFLFMMVLISALSACVIDEVTSIIFVVAAIFEICDYFEVDATPFLIISVLATNVGSAGTALGNPIGILIASKSGLTFEDFIIKAFPIAMICLAITLFIVKWWYRKDLERLDAKIRELGSNDMLVKLISIPPDRKLKISLYIFGATLLFIALHRRLELMWGLEPNTILFCIPLISSGAVMIWKRTRARYYVEHDVEWWTLLFFMLLFAQAGTLKYSGATDFMAGKLVMMTKENLSLLIGTVLWIATIGSSILDNVVLVAAMIPVVEGFKGLSINVQPLWWALLFGGCFGGNITLVGSTANIVALGILEKERNMKMTFFKWFWVGLTVGLTTTVAVWIILMVVPWYR